MNNLVPANQQEGANDTTPPEDANAVAAKPSKAIPLLRGFKRQHLKTGMEPAENLLKIFSWMRPHNSAAEAEFIHEFLDKIGCESDAFGNRFFVAGDRDKTTTLWSCHTDTVHHDSGYQRLEITKAQANGDYLVGVHDRDGSCLGADDGTGIWLLLEMIKSGIPGLYMFHRGEEVGCQGSKWIAEHNKDFLKGIQRAIAFDRKDYDNIITHQCGTETCSNRFALALGQQLGLGYKPDPSGMFTDTNSYKNLIPECTNLSVGYMSAHGMLERQNLSFALRLRESVLKLKPEELPTHRDPKVISYRSSYHGNSNAMGYDNGGYNLRNPPIPGVTIYGPSGKRWAGVNNEHIKRDNALTLLQLVRSYPQEACTLLRHFRVTEEDFMLELYGNDYFEFMT